MNSPAFIKLGSANVSAGIEDVTLRNRDAAQTSPSVDPAGEQSGAQILPRSGGTDFAALRASPKFFYRWSRLLSSTLIRLRSKFDGDFDQYLIYMVFVLSDLSRRNPTGSQATNAETISGRDIGLNTLSVADITEIPRETARRKLRLLVNAGYLRRGDNQLYYLGDRYDSEEFLADLAPLLADATPS